MIIFLLLVIIAIMLFGSAAVLGVIGVVISLALAFVLFAFAYSDPWGTLQVAIGLLILFVVTAAIRLKGPDRAQEPAQLTKYTAREIREANEQREFMQKRRALFASAAPNKAEKKAKRRQAGL